MSDKAADIAFHTAAAADLPAILALIVDDQLGAARDVEDAGEGSAYRAAFDAIAADPNNELVVVRLNGQVIGTMQLSYLPGLARRGAWRGQIEAVRVASHLRGRGVGRRMMQWAVDRCRARGCALVQLTSDKSRTEAHRFYAGLGFVASHEGYKIKL
ncbi:MAG: GNAT family N-acetyltransferase [Pseudomonadota bacterium]